MFDNLLQTKLHKPALQRLLLTRPRLIEKLDRGLAGKLTLISAPAGFGKTTLVNTWLSTHDRPVAWLSLDENDQELHTFFSYLGEATRSLTGVGNTLTNLLQASSPISTPSVPATAFATTFLNDVSTAGRPFILVLDDYHLVNRPDINQAVSLVLEHMPDHMHLVITTRTDPLLPLPRLRARGQMVELRTDDLRFTGEETVAFLQLTMGLTLTAEQVDTLAGRIEGWVAGLQMAGLSLQQFQTAEQIQHFVTDFSASHRYIFDYLTDEVLAQRPADTRDFLLQTSLLDRFNADLCTAVTGQGESQAILESLDNANLFLFPLDENRHWYRYHHLFGDLLRQRLHRHRPELIPTLYLRAGRWYENQGQMSISLQYLLAGEYMDESAQLLARVAPDFINRSEIKKLLDFAEQIPEETQSRYPRLCLSLSWAYLFSGDIETTGRYIRQAEAWLASPDGFTDDYPEALARANVATIRAYHASRLGKLTEAITYSESALAGLAELPAEMARPLRGTIMINLGLTYTALDKLEKAEAAYRQGITISKENGRIFGVMGSYSNMMVLQQRQGRLKAAQAAGLQALAWIETHTPDQERNYPAEGEIHRELGTIFYELNLLTESKEHLQKGLELYRYTSPDELGTCLHHLFLVEMAGDNLENALRLHKQIEPIIREMTPNLYRAHMARRSERLRRLSRRHPENQQWVEELHQWQSSFGLHQSRHYSFRQENLVFIFARVLVALNRLEDAHTLLKQLTATADAAGRWGNLIQYLTYQALVLNQLSQSPAAVDHLSRAVLLAEKDGYLRTFLDEADRLWPLLMQCPSSSYRDTLIKCFLEESLADAPALPPLSASPPTLLDPLSDREMDVLPLLASHLSGPEIAEQLHVSPNTLKTHIKNIYSKLGVHSRNEAVVKAQAAGLL